jgi:hypothetical protein
VAIAKAAGYGETVLFEGRRRKTESL